MDLRRVEIIRFLQAHQIAWVEDASNKDLRFDRNRIRQILIPFLEKQYNSNVVAVLHRTADLCWQEECWFQTFLAPILNEIVTSLDADGMALSTQGLSAEPLAIRRRLVREALRRWRGGLKRIRADHIDNLIHLLDPRSEGKRICLPDRVGVERTRSHLRFSIRQGRGCLPIPHAPEYLYQVPFPGSQTCTVGIPESGLKLQFSVTGHPGRDELNATDKNTAWFNAGQLTFPLVIRNFRPGDRMSPLGLQGHQKIKKIFGDRKIPIARRHRTPILVSGKDILWVAGIRRSALAIPAGQTTRVLKVRIIEDPA